MSDVDTSATDTVASNPGAPPVGGQQDSPPASVDTTASQPSDPDAGAKPKEDPDRKASRAFASQRRTINELQRTIGRLEERLTGIQPPASQAKAGPPKQSEYNTFDDWQAARDEWLINQAAEKFSKAAGEKTTQKETQERTRETGAAFWRAAAKEAKEQGIEGFEEAAEAIRDEEVPTSPFMGHYVIEEADNKAALIVWLADNPDEAARIAKLDPVKAGAALAKVDARMGKKPSPVSKAPAPVPQPTGGGTASQAIDRMSHEDLKALTAKWGRS